MIVGTDNPNAVRICMGVPMTSKGTKMGTSLVLLLRIGVTAFIRPFSRSQDICCCVISGSVGYVLQQGSITFSATLH